MLCSIRTGLLAGATLVAVPALQLGAVMAQLQDQSQISPTNALPNPYERVHPWGELPTGLYDERSSFIGAEQGPDGNIYLLGRCLQNSCTGRPEPPVLKLDPSGRLLKTWGSGMLEFPHGFDVDDEGNVWASDQRGHQVFKWDSDGELLMTLGQKGMQGDPPRLLTQPTDLGGAPNGNIFVTEGHGQGANRVSKYSSDGRFIMSWGTTGSGVGEFIVPHTIALDSQGRVFVGDRMNNRIQIFDQQGNHITTWTQFGRPSGIAFDSNGLIYVADSESDDVQNPGWEMGIRIGEVETGWVTEFIRFPWADPRVTSGNGAEFVAVDRDGNMYGGEPTPRMLRKYVRVRP